MVSLWRIYFCLFCGHRVCCVVLEKFCRKNTSPSLSPCLSPFTLFFFSLTSIYQYIKTVLRSKWPNLTKLSWKHMNENLNSRSPFPFPGVFGSVAVWYFGECHSHGRICPNRKSCKFNGSGGHWVRADSYPIGPHPRLKTWALFGYSASEVPKFFYGSD